MAKNRKKSVKIQHAIANICWSESYWTGLCPNPEENNCCKSYSYIKAQGCPRNDGKTPRCHENAAFSKFKTGLYPVFPCSDNFTPRKSLIFFISKSKQGRYIVGFYVYNRTVNEVYLGDKTKLIYGDKKCSTAFYPEAFIELIKTRHSRGCNFPRGYIYITNSFAKTILKDALQEHKNLLEIEEHLSKYKKISKIVKKINYAINLLPPKIKGKPTRKTSRQISKKLTDKELNEFYKVEYPHFTGTSVVIIRKNIKKLALSYKKHQHLLKMLLNILKRNGYATRKVKNCDLVAIKKSKTYIFEVKSARKDNLTTQIKAGIAQLYTYRFFNNNFPDDTKLCLMLEQYPLEEWEKFIENDRNILLLWTSGTLIKAGKKTCKELSFL